MEIDYQSGVDPFSSQMFRVMAPHRQSCAGRLACVPVSRLAMRVPLEILRQYSIA
jgi:hypothetical protein